MKNAAPLQYTIGVALVAYALVAPYFGEEVPTEIMGLIGAWLSPSVVTLTKALQAWLAKYVKVTRE